MLPWVSDSLRTSFRLVRSAGVRLARGFRLAVLRLGEWVSNFLLGFRLGFPTRVFTLPMAFFLLRVTMSGEI